MVLDTDAGADAGQQHRGACRELGPAGRHLVGDQRQMAGEGRAAAAERAAVVGRAAGLAQAQEGGQRQPGGDTLDRAPAQRRAGDGVAIEP
jgi:hypothetical protein